MIVEDALRELRQAAADLATSKGCCRLPEPRPHDTCRCRAGGGSAKPHRAHVCQRSRPTATPATRGRCGCPTRRPRRASRRTSSRCSEARTASRCDSPSTSGPTTTWASRPTPSALGSGQAPCPATVCGPREDRRLRTLDRRRYAGL